jgi:hypothetical protein
MAWIVLHLSEESAPGTLTLTYQLPDPTRNPSRFFTLEGSVHTSRKRYLTLRHPPACAAILFWTVRPYPDHIR